MGLLDDGRECFPSSLGSQFFVRRQVGPHPRWSCSFVATSCLASLRSAAVVVTVARGQFSALVGSRSDSSVPVLPRPRASGFPALSHASGRTLLPSPPPVGKLAHIAFCEGLRSCLRRRFQRALGRCAAVPSTCRLTRRSSGPAGSWLLLRSTSARPAAHLDPLGVRSARILVIHAAPLRRFAVRPCAEQRWR